MPRTPIPNDWDGVSWCCSVVEWPDSPLYRAIFVGLLTTPTRGRFWDERTGSILDVQAIGEEIENRNFSEECQMGCMEDLVNAVNTLALSLTSSIANSGNCGCAGTGGAGIFENPASSFIDDGSNLPDGYGDRVEYLSAKCKLANYILDRWVVDLTNIRQINVAGMTSEVLAIVLGGLLLLSVPFALIIGLVGALLALVAISIDAFVDALDELIAWVEGLDVCLLYSAVSAIEAKQNLFDALDAQTFTNDALTKELGEYFINFNTLNILFDEMPATINIDQIPETRPCTGCDAPACGCNINESTIIYIGTETGRSYTAPTLTLEADSEFTGGAYKIQVGVDDVNCSLDCIYKILSWSWDSTTEPFVNGFYTAGGTFVPGTYDVDTLISVEEEVLAVILQHNTEAWHLTIEVSRP